MKASFLKVTAILSIFALCLSSCSGTKDDKKDAGKLSDLPSWVLDPVVEDGVGGVGIAPPSRGGIKFQIPKAEMDAKANIAATIQTEINRVTKEALRESNVNGINDVEDFFSQATKEVVKNLPLSGVKRINIFQADDGTLYVHMVLRDEDYSKYLKNSQKTLEKSMKEANIGRENINNSEKASQKIFDELEKERN